MAKIQGEYKRLIGSEYVVLDTVVFDAASLPKTYRVTYDSGKHDYLKKLSKITRAEIKVWRVKWGVEPGSHIRFKLLEEPSP